MAAPSNQVMTQGLTGIGADYLNTLLQWTTNIASLRQFIGAVPNQVVYMIGYATPLDGGQGHYYWNPTNVAADNGTSIIVPPGISPGGWIRLG